MHMFTLGVVELQQRPDLQTQLLAGPQETGRVVEELLRYVGMAKGMLRVAREDFDWHGQSIRRGDFVYGMNIAANRDPRVWDRLDEILPERENRQSMAFGPGMHFCLGHLLAKMELGEFFNELFGNYTVEILSEKRRWINSFFSADLKDCRFA